MVKNDYEQYKRVNWEDAPSKNTPLDAEHLNIMDNAIAQHDVRISSIEDAVIAQASNQSDAYDPGATYEVGDIRIHENMLYRCTTPIDTPEQWDASHWEPTNFATEIANIKNSLGTQVTYELDGTTLNIITK